MLLATGLLAVVDSTHAFDTLTTVYNFEVERTHTYFVGNIGILVHNQCYSPKQIRNKLTSYLNNCDSKLTTAELSIGQSNSAFACEKNVYSKGPPIQILDLNANADYEAVHITQFTTVPTGVIDNTHPIIADFFDINGKNLDKLTIAINDVTCFEVTITSKTYQIKRDPAKANKAMEILYEPVGVNIHKRCRLPALKPDGSIGMNFEVKRSGVMPSLPPVGHPDRARVAALGSSWNDWSRAKILAENQTLLSTGNYTWHAKYLNIHLYIR